MAESFRADYDGTIAEKISTCIPIPMIPTPCPLWCCPKVVSLIPRFDNLRNYYFRQNLEYNNTFGDDHLFNFFGSMELRSTDRQTSRL